MEERKNGGENEWRRDKDRWGYVRIEERWRGRKREGEKEEWRERSGGRRRKVEKKIEENKEKKKRQKGRQGKEGKGSKKAVSQYHTLWQVTQIVNRR